MAHNAQFTPQEVKLPNGQNALVFIPDLSEQPVIVDLSVIERLAELLPKAELGEIKMELYNRMHEAKTMPEYVKVLREELNFHASVNMIRSYNPATKGE